MSWSGVSDCLRKFRAVFVEHDCSGMSGEFRDSLFFRCRFKKLNGLSLINCDLNQSSFDVDSVADAQGLTISLNCHSFRGVRLSPLLFELMLYLLSITAGNDNKRQQLVGIIGIDKASAFSKLLDKVDNV